MNDKRLDYEAARKCFECRVDDGEEHACFLPDNHNLGLKRSLNRDCVDCEINAARVGLALMKFKEDSDRDAKSARKFFAEIGRCHPEVPHA